VPLVHPFDFDRDRGRFTLRSVHPHSSWQDVAEHTGFEFAGDGSEPTTLSPDESTLDLIRTDIAQRVAETYPNFARKLFGVD